MTATSTMPRPDPNAAATRPPASPPPWFEHDLRKLSEAELIAHVLEGPDPAAELVRFAHDRGVTQIYLGRVHDDHWSFMAGHNFIKQVVRLARDVEVTIVAERKPAPPAS